MDADKAIAIVGRRERTGRGGFIVEVFSAEDGKIVTAPLPHVERHSPDGFNWGYGGSGPADLALSILAFVSGDGEAMKSRPALYQAFKNDVVAVLPSADGFTLPVVLVQAWLAIHARGGKGK
jgi:hypothetical protein